MLTNLRNWVSGRYANHPEAVIISCFYNPQRSPYRLLAFSRWYQSIKHLNYRIIECLIGPDAQSQLPKDPNIIQVRTQSLLWHKEALLNKLISELPEKYKYVFWIDADVLFTNRRWLVDAVDKFETGRAAILQPFERCFHLERNQLKPTSKSRQWRSFSANWTTDRDKANSTNYDEHGHVGFAWGACRWALDVLPLYDKALVGGADHIIAHAATVLAKRDSMNNRIAHPCISKSFTDNLDEIARWSQRCYSVYRGNVNYVEGDLYHIWHGDIAKRQYLKRVKEFTKKTKQVNERDTNGLYVVDDDSYVRNYFHEREVVSADGYAELAENFVDIMGYAIEELIQSPDQIVEEPRGSAANAVLVDQAANVALVNQIDQEIDQSATNTMLIDQVDREISESAANAELIDQVDCELAANETFS